MTFFSDKDKKRTTSYDKKVSRVQAITWVGVFCNISLAAAKFILGVFGRSHALVADAVHSLSDLITDFAVIIGVKYWEKPADEDHPYGHQKVEAIVTLIIGVMLFFIGMAIAYDAIQAVRSGQFQQPGWMAFAGAILSIIVKEILYHWTLRVGKKVRSSAVVANAWHHRTDAFTSIPVAVTVAIAAINEKLAFLDSVGAFLVSLFIVYAAWNIMYPALAEMVDSGASQKMLDRIEKIVLSVAGVESYHELRSRQVGQGWFIDLHIQVRPNLTVKEGHAIATHVEQNLLSSNLHITDVVIHLEPVEGT